MSHFLGNSWKIQGSDAPIQKSDRRRPGARRFLDRNPSGPYHHIHFLQFLVILIISYYVFLFPIISYDFLLQSKQEMGNKDQIRERQPRKHNENCRRSSKANAGADPGAGLAKRHIYIGRTPRRRPKKEMRKT